MIHLSNTLVSEQLQIRRPNLLACETVHTINRHDTHAVNIDNVYMGLKVKIKALGNINYISPTSGA